MQHLLWPVLAIALAAQAATLRTIYNFSGFTGDGSYPESGVVIAPDGMLYGTTLCGGNLASGCARAGCGTVFQMTPPASSGQPWTESVIYRFSGSDGRSPGAGLIQGSQGELYGTTGAGGAYDWGTVFRLNPPSTSGSAWTLTTLYTFSVADDGVAPLSIVMGSSGILYGTTRGGSLNPTCGPYGCGTVYSLTPNSSGSAWTHTVLHNFAALNGDGSNPFGGLVYGPTGALYGGTSDGGTGNCTYMSIPGCGTIYQLTPPATPGSAWTETIIHNFTGPSQGDGWNPNALVMGKNGVLYGTTQFGGNVPSCTVNCGTVFELKPTSVAGGTWTESILYSFQGTTDGGWPQAGVILTSGGALLGTTSAYQGSFFELQPPTAVGSPWTFTVLGAFKFPSQGGATPTGPLAIDPTGLIYGTTSQQNYYMHFGAVYQMVR